MRQSTYQTLDDFYAGEPGTIGSTRKWSGELDFGVWWKDRTTMWPRYRVSLVKDTGELYAWRQAAIDDRPNVVILGVMCTPDGKGDVDRVEAALDGWAEKCGESWSLQWVHDRMVEARATETIA